MTGDRAWLASEGWPVLREVADFWVSRAEWNPDGSCSIRGVVGADEFAHHVTDNAFTNGSAIVALRAALAATEILSADDQPAVRGKRSQKGDSSASRASRLSADTESWAKVADGLRILQRADGVTSEFEGYDGQTVKQADVNLLAYPLGIITDSQQIRRDLEYYEPRIHPHGPAMSQAILALQWARLGDGTKAWELYRKGLEGHLHGPFLAFSETAGHGDICFMTGLGGFLQLFINGFCGLELTDGGVVQLGSEEARRSGIPGTVPALPPHWKSITVTGVGPQRLTYTNSRH
jgi:trehalose/maltose hydrolase-like predicted phosphorylase